EATLTAGEPPVRQALHLGPEVLRVRTERLAAAVEGQVVARLQGAGSAAEAASAAADGELSAVAEAGSSPVADTGPSSAGPRPIAAAVVAHAGRVGGGGGTGVGLPGWALALPEAAAAPLRTGTPAVVGRVHEGRCL